MSNPAIRPLPPRGFTMRTPKTLPDVPTDDELRAAVATCPDTLEGTKNRALILVLADSGLWLPGRDATGPAAGRE